MKKEIKKAVLAVGLFDCFIVAVQWSCIGMGNKSFGFYKDSNGMVKSIRDLMDVLGVNYKATINSKLEPGELTPKRLGRFFRYEIKRCIHEHKIPPSFLWYKYNRKTDPSMCFPGAEYMVIGDDAEGVLVAYANVDTILKTSFHTRIKRIIEVRAAIMESQWKP